MRKLTLYVSVIAAALLLGGGMSHAQQTQHEQHHSKQKADTSKAGMTSCPMMSSSQQMGKGMMLGGMMKGMQGGMMQGMMGGQQEMRGGMMQGMMSGGMMKGMHGGMMQGMMAGGMMGRMSSLQSAIHTIHHLSQQKAKLSLSDSQVKQLENLKTAYQKKQIDWQAAVKKKEIDLKTLVDGNRSTSEVRKVLKGIYDDRLESDVAAYDTAQKMLSILTPEQKKKWKEFGGMGMGRRDSRMMMPKKEKK